MTWSSVVGTSCALAWQVDWTAPLTALTYPDGSVADYMRDTQGRISQIGLSRPGHGQAQQQAIWLDNYPVALINVPVTDVPGG